MMRDLRRLSYVTRWGIVPRLRPQSVAEHSYFVAMYTDALCVALDLDPASRGEALRYALQHDVDEGFTGDLPSPMKEHVRGLSVLSDTVRGHILGVVPEANPTSRARAIVRCADLLDAVLWLVEEESLGNRKVEALRQSLYASLISVAERLGDAAFQLVRRLTLEASTPLEWYVEGLDA